MLWSFIGGASAVGWLKSDEENWDEAINLIIEELKKTKGLKALDEGRARLRFCS
jgi:hypothetical protein